MADEEHVKRLKEGAEAWNAWRKGNPKVKPELRGAYSRGAYLRGAYLRGADLSEANFQGADLRGADLSRANLSGADLSEADLSEANFRYSYLSYADFHGADFSEADLRGSNLRNAVLIDASLRDSNFAMSVFWRTVLGRVDLSEAKGLDNARHRLSSIIDTDTLYRSKGKIPDAFLRGCGLADWEIAASKLHDPDLTPEQVIDLTYEIARIKSESPIQVSPVFISYSHEDGEFVDALESRFDEKRIRYWRDIHDASSGPLEEIVDRAMRVNRILLLVLSETSVESDWVELEVTKARELAKQSRDHVLCPVALDDSWRSCRWERRLRLQVEKYNILDFSDWKDKDALAAAFQRLIDGLGIYYPKVAGSREKS